MKKIRLVQAVGIVLFIGYLILLLIDAINGFLGNNTQLVLSVIMAVIGINLIFKGTIIKSSSTMWFANVLISLSVTIIVANLLRVEMRQVYYLMAIIPLFASIVNLIVFNNLTYIKVIIINISIIAPIIIEYFYGFDIYWSIGLFVISILIGVMVCRLINLDKEKV